MRGLLDQLCAEFPALANARASVAVAVNREYVNPDYVLSAGDEVALIPPVSGGRDV